MTIVFACRRLTLERVSDSSRLFGWDYVDVPCMSTVTRRVVNGRRVFRCPRHGEISVDDIAYARTA